MPTPWFIVYICRYRRLASVWAVETRALDDWWHEVKMYQNILPAHYFTAHTENCALTTCSAGRSTQILYYEVDIGLTSIRWRKQDSKNCTWVHVLSYFQPLTACINLPVSALSLCTDSRPSGSGSLSLTAPHSAPTLTENIKTIILTDKFTDFCNEHKGSWDTSDRFTLHRLCRPPVLLLGYLELLSLERRNISLATNHSHSNILVPWANRRIMTGPRKHARFVDKMPLLTRPLSRCPRAKHITVKQK